ncbi:hypothetical protein ACSFBU_20335 [Variovorax sp. ZT5P30]
MKNAIEISTRRSSDGRRVFIDRMLISIEDLTFGDEEAVSVSGLMIGAIDDLLSNIEKQKINTDFAKKVFGKKFPAAHFFHLLHNACWKEGDWPRDLGNSVIAPSAYIGLPSGTEIFDADEAYFVVLDLKEAIFFAKDKIENKFVALRMNVLDYTRVWEQIRAEIFLRKIESNN